MFWPEALRRRLVVPTLVSQLLIDFDSDLELHTGKLLFHAPSQKAAQKSLPPGKACE
jgi:hypothetical protein